MGARRLADGVVSRGGIVIALAAAVSLLAGLGYLRLAWTDDPEVITLEGSDALAFYREYVARWGSDELIVLAYEVPDAFEPGELARLRRLTDALFELEGVRWVSSLDTAFVIDTGPFGPFARPLVPDEIPADGSLRRAALASPFVRDSLVTADGRMLLLAVQLEGAQLSNDARERRVLAGIDALLASDDFAALDVHLAGSPVFNRALSELNQRDNALFTPLVLVLIALALWLAFRSAPPALLIVGVVCLTELWTLGAMSALGVPMNITTSLLPPLLMVIAVADSVHVLSAYGDRLAAGDSRRAALTWTFREIGPACLWTSATTALGFASLLLVRIESVRSFALFAVLGVAVAFIHSLVLLPCLMARLPLQGPLTRGLEAPRTLVAFCSRCARRPAVGLAILGVSFVVGVAGLAGVEVATHDGEFFSASHPINRAYRAIEARAQGVTPFEIEIAAPDSAQLRSAAGLAAVRELQDGMAQIPELTRGTSLADLLLAASPGLDLADDAAVERGLVLLGTLAPGEVERWIRRDPPRARISARALAMTSARSDALLREVQQMAVAVLPAGWTARATGLVPVFAQMEQYLVDGQLQSWSFAFVGVAAILLGVFRSLRLALLAVAANLVPLALAAAVMGLAGIRLDVATIMVAAVALGIIVDDTIHLLVAFRRGLAAGLDRERALDRALALAGRPIVLTSALLICGFGTLVLSGFQPTAHFGLLVCVAVAGALAADLWVLPPGLLRFAPLAGLALLLCLPLPGHAQATTPAAAGDSITPFSAATEELPAGWEPLHFSRVTRHTLYEVVREDGVAVVRADSRAAASGLIHAVDVDLRRTPILHWRWKVEGVLRAGDVSSKSGDDYPARLYVTFAYEPGSVGLWRRMKYLTARKLFGDLPIAAINYLWASRAPVGSIVDNAYAGDFVKMIVVESGAERAGEWRVERRNVYEDYLRAFGSEPPPVTGVAIMTDTDDTGEAAVAFYGDLRFEAEPER